MKRIDITVPKGQKGKVEEVLAEYADDITSTEGERDDRKVLQFQVAVDSDDIDELTEELKGITDIESGDLTIEVLEQTARIEKGQRREGGTSGLSVQEMYSKAFEFSAFNAASWALIALGAGIAVFGLLTENVTVVVGSMVIAPLLGPFIAISFGLVIGDRKLIRKSTLYGGLSIVLAIVAAFLVSLPLPLQSNSLIRLISNPGFATIPLSLFVGAAAALTFTTEAREALAGVAVAIALVPPAGVAGIALAMQDVGLFLDISLVIVTNVTALILAGSVTFKLVGVAPSTYYRKQVSKQQMRRALIISVTSIVIIAVIVGYFTYNDFQDTAARTEAARFIDAEMGDRVLQQDIQATPGTLQVDLVIIDPQYTEPQLATAIEERTGRTVTVSITGVRGVE